MLPLFVVNSPMSPPWLGWGSILILSFGLFRSPKFDHTPKGVISYNYVLEVIQMKEKITDLDPETSVTLSNIIMDQMRETFLKVIETEKWLTQHNFLVNAGGSAAVLTYLASDPTPTFAIFPLVIFLTGIFASGIEIRTMLYIYSHLHLDAARRREGWSSGEYTVEESSSVKLTKPYIHNLNHWSGIYAQIAFLVGSLVGVVGFYCAKV